ncbi:BCLAF1 and THRAP3 family member 3 isoform X1 [Bufo gargarizans]|uniref:BCLAF1 and THRAP3 family member 3 isoform X1 n=1 Tax=Bufo gargarizans TaxID=30331 RepID=UPI001CF4F4CC|nr:BCLAF1 and THRAP3 family member 3 isoform X1 [Bufo gargarizans]XP_044139910.1 BCLAF1 and THRAP3 family member 3 isoform X1 [Bufo gargarizans]
MAKSRSRSPKWKSRPPPYKSPERNRRRHFHEHYQDGEGFHRGPRRPKHWEEERHGQSNFRMTPYKRFNDNNYEPDAFSADLRKSPFESSSRFKRMHSPDRRGDGNRRFPAKYPEDRNRHGHREHRDYHHRNQELNAHTETNGFKHVRREGSSHRSYHREPDRDWHDHDGQWNQDHTDPYLPPSGRRSEEFVDQNVFQKRHPEDRDYREHEPLPKRTREPDRHDYRPPPRHSHWNDDHTLWPHHDKDWSKDADLRDPSPVVYQTHSGELAKIEYDYSHRSPSYVHVEPPFLNDHAERDNRYEDKKNFSTRTSQHNRSNMSNRERGTFSERSPEQTTKYSEKKAPDRGAFKTDNLHLNHKHKESGREAEYRREPSSKRHLDNHSPKSSDPTITPKTNCEKESIMVNLELKKSVDKYRQPHEHWNISKDIQPKSDIPQGKRNSEQKMPEKDVLKRQPHEHWNISKDIQPKSDIPQGKRNSEQKMPEKDVQKRSNSTSYERQMSEDLVAVGRKDAFHPVFDHLSSSTHGGTNAPSTEFTQEIITIIHEVKANHFKSTEMSLHERFSKLQAESNKEELNLNRTTAQANPEIHRRIDISLEDLQKKTLHKTEVSMASQRVIDDPNDLRHDIERRRKQRLHSEEDSNANVSFCDSDAPGSYFKPRNNDTGEFQKLSRGGTTPFRKSTGRPPGWKNPAPRM